MSPLDRIGAPPNRFSSFRIFLAVVVSVGLHAGVFAWSLQQRDVEEARSAGGSDSPVLREGESVILLDSLPSDFSDGAEPLPEAKPMAALPAEAVAVAEAVPAAAVEDLVRAPAVEDTPAPVAEATRVALADDAVPVAEAATAATVAEESMVALAAEAPMSAVGDVPIAPDSAAVVAALSQPDRATRPVADTAASVTAVESDRPVGISETPPRASDTDATKPAIDSAPKPVRDTAAQVATVEDARPVAIDEPAAVAEIPPQLAPVADTTKATADDAPKPVRDTEIQAAAVEDATPPAQEEPPPETPPKPVAKAAPKPPPPPKPAPRSEQRAASIADDAAESPNAGNAGAGGASNVERGKAAMSRYQAQLAAHLRRFRTFPEEARKRGASGTVTVSFTVNASGGVSGARLARGSGVAVLDAAALAMVRRASPFPPIPPGLGVRTLTVNVPVRFDLK